MIPLDFEFEDGHTEPNPAIKLWLESKNRCLLLKTIHDLPGGDTWECIKTRQAEPDCENCCER